MRSVQLIFASILSILIFSCSEKEPLLADQLNQTLDNKELQMYVIERDIPGAGSLSPSDLQAISQSSCEVIDGIGRENIRWLHSYVTGTKVYCIYAAKDKGLIQEHAKQGGFPVNSIQEVATVIHPGTATE